MNTSLAEIVSKIKSHTLTKRPILIGIEGFGGSGKTTFAGKLREALDNAYVVNIDDFIVKEKFITEPSWDKGGLDRERLEKQVLMPASKGQPISYEELLWGTNTLSAPKVVSDVDYLIVEGISCYHPDIARYYDYRIWVDTSIEVAKRRGLARASDENAQYWDLWAENDLRYQEKYHPEKIADFIVDNSLDN